MTTLNQETIVQALSRVDDPEIGKPITELDMVRSIKITGSDVAVVVSLTIAGCPMKDRITANVRAALEEIPGIGTVTVSTDVMTDEQRTQLRQKLRGSAPEAVIPFTQPGNTTRIFAVSSGKGGVGKSSMTVNLACEFARRGLSVGIVDADIYGHSVPGMMGASERPTAIDDMILPPQAHGVKMISIAHFVEGNAPVVWRGPMLHRAIQQFLGDVFWGDLDILLLDLPPGTGDIAISVAQLLPHAELLVVTTPQTAAAEVAERAGTISLQTQQKVAGVIENMGAMVLPDGSVVDVFGTGGGAAITERLKALTGTAVPLLGQVPLDPQLRVCGDEGTPLVLSKPDSPTAQAIASIVDKLMVRQDTLAGKNLGLGVK